MKRQRSGFSLFVPAVVLLAGAAFGVGTHLRNKRPERVTVTPTRLAQTTVADAAGIAIASTNRPKVQGADTDTESARRTFETVYNHVKQYYVDRLPGEKAMSYGAIRAMISSLNDPNCYFLEPEQYRLLKAESEGTFQGIGVALTVRPHKQDGYTDYKVTVVSPVPGSPAEKAGLKSGDTITHVDGRWVLGYDPYLKANKIAERIKSQGTDAEEEQLRIEVENARRRERGGISMFRAQMLLRGDRKLLTELKLPTEKRTVTILRRGLREPIKIEIPTSRIETPAVSGKVLNRETGYLRIAAFSDKTAAAVRDVLKSFPEGSGIILDLRGNPGGSLDSAMDVDALLAPNAAPDVFCYEVQSAGKTTALKPTGVSGSQRRSVVVLVDKGTASVAEALAASLVDKNGAALLGERTFGDAAVQMAFALPDGSAFVLNTGRMISPRRNEWATVGLAPRVTLAAASSEEQVLTKAIAVLKASPRVASTPTGVR